MAGWLRKILANRLTDKLRQAKRAPEVSLHQRLDQSSARLADLLAADQSTPSTRLSAPRRRSRSRDCWPGSRRPRRRPSS